MMIRWSQLAVISMLLLALGCEKEESQDWDTFAQSAPSFLYVLTGYSGSFTQDDNDTANYTLTIHAVAPDIIYFSDQPERIAGDLPLLDFISSWTAFAFNLIPPNAAIVLHEEDEESDIIIVEIMEAPLYDAFNETLTCKTRILKDSSTGGLAIFAEGADAALPETFESVSLFIDSCPIISFDPEDAINFDPDSRKTIGYITYLKVNGQVFQNDLPVLCPQDNGTENANVAGILWSASWKNNDTDTVHFNFLVSPENRRLAAGLGLSFDQTADVEYAFDIYSFDNASEAYIKTSHSNMGAYSPVQTPATGLPAASELSAIDLFPMGFAFQSAARAYGYVGAWPWYVAPPVLIGQSAGNVPITGTSSQDRLDEAAAWQYSFALRYSFDPYRPKTMRVILSDNCSGASGDDATFSIALTPDSQQSGYLTCTITRESGGFDVSQVELIPVDDNNIDLPYGLVSTDNNTRVIQFQQPEDGMPTSYRMQVAPLNVLADNALCAGLQVEPFPDAGFAAPVIPSIVRQDMIEIANLLDPRGSTRNLDAHLQTLFDLLFAEHPGYSVKLSAEYTYTTSSTSNNQITTTVPVLLYPTVIMNNTAQVAAQCAEDLKHWYTTYLPAQGGAFIIKISVFNADQSPILSLENLWLPTEKILDLAQ